jgi:hypothetical protein
VGFGSDNAYDIGASGANRPRTIWVGTDVNAANNLLASNAVLINGLAGAYLNVGSKSAGTPNTILRGFASQTADMLQIQNSATNLIFQFASSATMVNGIGFFPSPTLNDVRLQAQGTDASVGLRIATQGSGILGFYSNSTSNILATFNPVTSSVNYLQFNPSITGNPVSIQSAGPDTSIGLTLLSKGAGGGITLTAGASSNMLFTAGAYQFVGSPVFFRDGNNNTTLQLAQVASAVNAIQISPSVAAASPVIQSVGADTNIALILQAKGPTGYVNIGPNSTQVFSFQGVASVTDGMTFSGAATANPATVSIAASGTDANINLNLISKGTGIVQINGAAIASVIPHIVTFTANGTYTPTAGTKVSDVFIIGGGGGGGTGNNSASGGGGGAGGSVRKMIQNPLTIAASFAVVVGAGGVGQAVGSASTFIGGTISLSAGGGTNGGDPNSTNPSGGAGGTATGGDVNIPGNGGGAGSASTGLSAGGIGGSGPFGGAGASPATIGGGARAGNNAAANSGAGGSGGATGAGTNAAPGNGGSGICVIIEYF